jgi:hypothetical protein
MKEIYFSHKPNLKSFVVSRPTSQEILTIQKEEIKYQTDTWITTKISGNC